MLKRTIMLLAACTVFGWGDTLKEHRIVCEPQLLHNCTEHKCEDIPVVNIDGKQYFVIDTAKNTLAGKIGEETVDIEHITSRHGNERTFVFFGTHADSKFDWVLRINKEDGRMIILATNEALSSFTVYGICKWEETK